MNLRSVIDCFLIEPVHPMPLTVFEAPALVILFAQQYGPA